MSTTRALQFDILLTPIIDYRDNSVASAYVVYFYAAGTSTAKNVWTEAEKSNPYTSRTLGSSGTVQVYGDGVYKVIIKDTDGTTVYEWDNIKVQANTYTVQEKTDTYTATADDDMILCDGTFTLNLDDVTGFTHPLIVKRVSGSPTIDPHSTQTIDGDLTITLNALDNSAILYPDVAGESWYRADKVPLLDEDDMASDSDESGATQQSIKAYVDSGTVTMTNKRLTSPKINEDVALTATATVINMLVGSAITTISLGGDLTTSDAATLVKVGNLVMFNWNNNAHASANNATSAVGVIPAAYRPTYAPPARIPNLNNGGYFDVYVSTAGTVSVYHYSQDGVAQAQTYLFAGAMVWYVA